MWFLEALDKALLAKTACYCSKVGVIIAYQLGGVSVLCRRCLGGPSICQDAENNFAALSGCIK